MPVQPAFDLAPALRLMLMGIVLALGPLAWVWLRNAKASGSQRTQALTLLTLFLTFDLVLFGAFTRLTDSGLGCPDWPGCYGSATPAGAHSQISQAQAQMPTGPVTHGKAWIEMVHRYLATGVGVLILTLAASAWWQRRRGMRIDAVWPTVTLVWVCLQGAFGALTVTMKLFPAIVTLHLLGGLVLLALLSRQAVVQSRGALDAGRIVLAGGLRGLLAATFAVLWVQVALGGWVSTNYAVLACTDFPACQASWWPEMDFARGFEPWRELGKTAAGENIPFQALTAIHYTHRLFAFVAIAMIAWLVIALRRSGVLPAQARWLAALALLQLATGISNVVLDWPLVAAVLHTGGAAALVVTLTWALCATTSQRSEEAAANPAAREIAT